MLCQAYLYAEHTPQLQTSLGFEQEEIVAEQGEIVAEQEEITVEQEEVVTAEVSEMVEPAATQEQQPAAGSLDSIIRQTVAETLSALQAQ